MSPEPGTRCPTCDRRVNKPRRSSSPDTKRIYAALPPERADALAVALDALQAYVGADGASYPRGSVLELLAVLGGQHREELRLYFEGSGAAGGRAESSPPTGGEVTTAAPGGFHRHHRKRRSQGGTDAPENILLVSPGQHLWIHDNPARSYELGWLVRSWEDPSEVAVTAWDEPWQPPEAA